MAVGILVVELADENAVDIHRTLVQTRPDPQLQVEVERVVLHRAIGGGVDLRVSAIHRATESRLLRIAAGGGHCEIGERSARPFDRVQVDAAAVDPALHDTPIKPWSIPRARPRRACCRRGGSAIASSVAIEGPPAAPAR
jgi:hypothetical protein